MAVLLHQDFILGSQKRKVGKPRNPAILGVGKNHGVSDKTKVRGTVGRSTSRNIHNPVSRKYPGQDWNLLSWSIRYNTTHKSTWFCRKYYYLPKRGTILQEHQDKNFLHKSTLPRSSILHLYKIGLRKVKLLLSCIQTLRRTLLS